MKRRALVSVSDKRGVAAFARKLSGMGFEIISTGGTAKALEESRVPVVGVSEVTGAPEMLDGRVKTLHPKIHGGILADLENPEQVLSRSQIFERVWGCDLAATSNALGVYMGYLRRKLQAPGEPPLLRTVRGVGYRLLVD